MSGDLLIGVRQRLIALLCVIGMSFSASWTLPAFIGFVGQFDPDHKVLVCVSGEDFEVRFRHIDETEASQTSGGETALWANAPDSHDDHVMQFSSPGHALTQPPSPAGPDRTSVSIAAIEAEQWNPIVRNYLAIPHARPPPGETSLSRSLRSIVLLV
jgi:hypothetical protein